MPWLIIFALVAVTLAVAFFLSEWAAGRIIKSNLEWRVSHDRLRDKGGIDSLGR